MRETTKIVWNHVNYTKVFLVFDIHVKKESVDDNLAK
jgi:hypothetical protein